MKILDSLDVVADRYDAVFCDVWGVIHNGRRIFPDAQAALMRFRALGKAVVLLTNVPKPRDPIPRQLDRLGFSREAWDAIVTSGDAIRLELSRRAPGPMYKIGPPHDHSLWDGLGLAMSDLASARFIGISGLNDDRETPADYTATLAAARARNLDLICANPDIVVRVGDQLIWCAGAIARDYQEMGGAVILAGKPHAPIYELAMIELCERIGREVPRERILCIGDGVATDVKGANAQGFDSLFIASGMHGEALWTDGALDTDKVEAALAEDGVRTTYVMAHLA